MSDLLTSGILVLACAVISGVTAGDLEAVSAERWSILREIATSVQETRLKESGMARNERRMTRRPATKFPNLRKKMQKSKIHLRQVKKKG